jgi:hypothetical protein
MQASAIPLEKPMMWPFHEIQIPNKRKIMFRYDVWLPLEACAAMYTYSDQIWRIHNMHMNRTERRNEEEKEAIEKIIER